MNRREVLSAAGVAAAVAAAAMPAFAQDGHAGHDHSEHDHHGHDADMPVTPAALSRSALVATAFACLRTGQDCLNHCVQTLATGDTSLAACARSVDDMLAICGALARLASAGSSRLPEIARLAHAVCLDCEKECRKHEAHHATCKACAEACAACAESCKKAA